MRKGVKTDSKSDGGQPHVGSNPTLSANTMQIPDDLKINLKIQFVVTKRVAKAAVDTPLYILRRGSLYHFYVHYEHSEALSAADRFPSAHISR